MDANLTDFDLIFNRLRQFLIFQSSLLLSILFIFFLNRSFVEAFQNLTLIWISLAVHALTSLVFIVFIWKKMPYSNSKKLFDSFYLLFTGIIGCWIWFPNKAEIRNWPGKHN